MKAKQSIPNILTPEEKSLLRSGSRFLRSRGAKEGTIEIEIEGSFDDEDDIHMGIHFGNLYNVEIPEKLVEIIHKIFLFVIQKGIYKYPQVDDINYERIILTIDAVKQQVYVEHAYSYYEESDSEGRSWSLEEEPENKQLKEVFDSLNELEVNESIQNKTLELRYYGSGDSGYLEDYFDGTSILIPSKIEDWCYRQLENDFGGWEINEGSQGYFLFYLDQKEIELSHTMNVEEQSYDTLLEFDFSE